MVLTTRSSPASLILSTCRTPSSDINTVSVMCLQHSFTEFLCSHSVIYRQKRCHSVSFPTTLSVSLSLCVESLSSQSVCLNSVDTRSVYWNSDWYDRLSLCLFFLSTYRLPSSDITQCQSCVFNTVSLSLCVHTPSYATTYDKLFNGLKQMEVSTGWNVQPLFLKTKWENPAFESFDNKCGRPATKYRGNTFSVSGRLVILYMSTGISYQEILTLFYKVHFLLISNQFSGRVTFTKHNSRGNVDNKPQLLLVVEVLLECSALVVGFMH
jgi:hypothetical protein